MMDVKLIQKSSVDFYGFDISVVNDDFVKELGLETMVLVSLFSDAREDSRDDDKRGWWGAAVIDKDRLAAPFGSKLWLLAREKQTDETRVKIQEWCFDALRWMIEEGIVDRMEVGAEYFDIGKVLITIDLFRGERDPLTFKFEYLWGGQFGVQ